jgi:predicted dehydrogenase
MVRLGIIGMGWWGQMLLKAGGASGALRFVHGVSPNEAAARPVAAQHGIRFSPRVEDLFQDGEVQAVVIATPHSTHLPLIRQVAAAGYPVFCEKPLTLTRAEAVAAIEACQAAGVPLAVGHNRRFLPTIQAMKRIIAEGRLGRLLHIEGHSSNLNSSQNFAPWRADPQESPAGGLTGTGVHVIDAFTNLAGPAKRVTTQLTVQKPAPDARDSLSVMLEFANGMSGTLAAVRASPRYWRVHVFGDQANLETTSDTEIVLREDGKEPEVMRFAPVDTLRAELEAFAAAVAGTAPYPVPYAEMIANVATFEAVVKSVAAGGAPTAVEG